MKRVSQRGFSILEVIASMVILTFGILAAVRMQSTAISSSRAPVASQEMAAVARRALEEANGAGTETIGDYRVVVTTDGCAFTGTDLNCGGGAHATRITVTVTDLNDRNQTPYVVTTIRAAEPAPTP